MALVRKRTIPTERPPLISEVSATNKKTSCWFQALVYMLRSIARKGLVKQENSSAFATVNCNECKSEVAMY
jgi:hypothetical protein